MFSKIAVFLTSLALLAACAAPQNPPLPLGEGTGVRETPPTETATPIPTETPTPEATREAEDRWQTSPDGHIVYNEAQLYGGMFTIDTEHPEFTEKYWEDLVRGLWNLNSIGRNTAFLSQFPTADSLVEYLQDGGGPVNNLWIPVIYPNARRQFWMQATLEPVEGRVDLSRIAIAIYKPTRDEIYHYSPSYATGTRYISFFGAGGEVMIEKTVIDGNEILQFTFRRDLLFDSVGTSYRGDEYTILALSDEKTDEENLLAATQLIRFWVLKMQLPEVFDNGGEAWRTIYDPPLLNILSYLPAFHQFQAITTLDGTPLRVR